MNIYRIYENNPLIHLKRNEDFCAPKEESLKSVAINNQMKAQSESAMILNLFYMIPIRFFVLAWEGIREELTTDYRYLRYNSHIAKHPRT